MIRRTRLPRALQSGPGKSVYSIIGGSSTPLPFAGSPSKGVTHSWSSVAGLPPLNGLHAFRWQDFLSQDTIKCCLMLLFHEACTIPDHRIRLFLDTFQQYRMTFILVC